MKLDDEKNYREAMLETVSDAADLSSQNLTIAEKASKATVWARVLMNIIPEERLPDALERAFRQSRSAFPVNAYDLKNAWTEIEAEETAERERIAAEDKAINRVFHCAERSKHKSDVDALQEYGIGHGEYVWMPCHVCRLDAHNERQAQEIAKRKQTNEQIVLEMIGGESNVREFKTAG